MSRKLSTSGLITLRRGRARQLVAVAAALALAASLSASGVSLAGPGRPAALPGQATMSDAAVAATLSKMGPNERAAIGARMEDTTIRPIGYTSAYFVFAEDGNGNTILKEVDPTLEGLTASTDATLLAAETDRKYDLYMSQYVGRTSTTGTYEYLVETYADWKAGNDHMNAPNCGKDLLAVTWGGGDLSQGSRGTQSGKYGNWVTGEHNVHNLNIERWDSVPNVGVEYRFNEWRQAAIGCSGAWKMEWGRASLYLRKSTYNGKLTTIVSKYFHTYATQNYNLVFGAPPSVTISPAEDFWPLLLSQDIKV